MPTGLDGNPDPISGPVRDALLATLADEIVSGCRSGRICVGVDGAAGTGKSTLADELARALASAGRPVVRSTTDSFHHPRAVRYRQGRTSAEGYYRDSHDLGAIRDMLLDPFLEGNAYRAAAFDVLSDRPLDVPAQAPLPGAVLVFDGLFLHRVELREYWCYSIYLEATERLARARADAALRRPAAHLAALDQRYMGGWQLYVAECHPESLASRVVDNDDFAAPTFVRRNGPHAAA